MDTVMTDKRALEPMTFAFPCPVVLVGAMVGGKASFTTISWTGVVNSEPPMVSISVRPGRHIYKGIRESGVFSVNLPGLGMWRETDWCGTVSGARHDKVAECGFRLATGTELAVPLLADAPVNLECRVVERLELGTHHMFVGQVLRTWVAEDLLVNDAPDMARALPFVYTPGAGKGYYPLGESLGQAYSVKSPKG